MRQYLITASYSASGEAALMKEGGTHRKHAVENALAELGGKLEAMYYAFSEHDVYIIVHLPDDISAAALGLKINSSGAVRSSITVLLSCEDIDKATKKSVHYVAPGVN
jgi:uncharacterized protein with GYD domain